MFKGKKSPYFSSIAMGLFTAGFAFGQVANTEHQVRASDGKAYWGFGETSADADRGNIIIGATQKHNYDHGGAAYIYSVNGQTWSEHKLVPPDIQVGGYADSDLAGDAVAINGDYAFVGSPLDDDIGIGSGSVNVFKKTGGSWSWHSKLLAPDGVGHPIYSQGDWFGDSLASSGDWLAVGTIRPDGNPNAQDGHGAVYLYQFDGNNWVYRQKLYNGIYRESFGSSVDIDGNRLVVGAIGAGGSSQGRVYVYEYNGSSWIQTALLADPNGQANDYLGSSVALSGNRIASGALYGDSNGLTDSGYISTFELINGNWVFTQRILPPASQNNDFTGRQVAMYGDRLAFSSYANFAGGTDNGVFLYQHQSGSWQFSEFLLPSYYAADVGNNFGSAIAMSDLYLVAADDQWSNSSTQYQYIGSASIYMVGTDSDADGVGNTLDNCPSDSNADQLDADGDGLGDVCDDDRDGDGYQNHQDTFPDNANEWSDSDGDGVGDNSDVFPNNSSEWSDGDGDGIGDNSDNCPASFNATQADQDGDGYGDVCDTDIDGDGVHNSTDAFPNNPNEWLDSDGDGVGDNSDLYPSDPYEHSDSDGDGVGDNADVFPNDASESGDADCDGVGDNGDVYPNDPSESADSDGDGIGDNADAFPNNAAETQDTDADGVGDNSDNCPETANNNQADVDADGIGNVCDPDRDGDGIMNENDAFPSDAAEWSDFDGDGVGDNADNDDDNDGVSDANDAFPYNASESSDNDGDGLGDNADGDDDNDSIPDEFDNDPNQPLTSVQDSDGDAWPDEAEIMLGTDPHNAQSKPL